MVESPPPKKDNEPSAPVSMQPPVNLTHTLPWPLQVWFDYLSPAPHRHGWGFCRCTVVVLVTGGSSSCSCSCRCPGGPNKEPWPTGTQPCYAWWTSVWSLHRWFGSVKIFTPYITMPQIISQNRLTYAFILPWSGSNRFGVICYLASKRTGFGMIQSEVIAESIAWRCFWHHPAVFGIQEVLMGM